MKRTPHICGAVLPTVMVVSVLLLLTVLGLASLWEADFLFFSKHRHDAMQRANVESGFVLYGAHPRAVMDSLDEEGHLLLYDSLPHSRIRLVRKAWGLYEVVTIYAHDERIHSSRIMGRRSAGRDDVAFFYRDNTTALTLTGKTRLKGRVRAPANGLIYGQMGSVSFDGEKLAPAMIKESDKELPETDAEAVEAVKRLLGLLDQRHATPAEDSLRRSFRENEAEIFSASGTLKRLNLSGNIVLVGKDIVIESSCRLGDVIVVGENIRIRDGFRGSLQAFATDSLIIGENVALDYPSGLYSEKYVGIGDGCEVNGYAIVSLKEAPDARYANYVQSRLSTVRGTVYISGIAQLQGIVSGAVFLDKAVYYSPRGYYENMIYDATVLENREMAAPLWLGGPAERKEAKWVY